MKKCYWCGEEIEDEAKVCLYCGRNVLKLNSKTPVIPEPKILLRNQPKKCYWCGEEIEDEAKVCPYCGRNVLKLNSGTPAIPELKFSLRNQPKKCYWCGAELEDRAEVCAYCGREVNKLNSGAPVSPEAERTLHYFPNPEHETYEPVNLPPVIQTKNIPQGETEELPPLKWHQNIFVRAIFFGIMMGFILTRYVLNSTSPNAVWGYSGYLSNAIGQGCTNVVVYSGVYLLLGNIYRGRKKKTKYTDIQQRREILRAEFSFVIGVIFLFVFAFLGIEKLVITAGNKAAVEPTIMNISKDTIVPPKNATPTKIMATPTKKVSTPDPVINQKERALKNSLIAYKDKPYWAFKPYLDDLELVINGNAVIITLLKSPVTEAEFKQVAYELIGVTAYHIINGPISIKRSDWALDFNVYSIRVISEKMADYTIAGYVEGYEKIKKMADEKHTEDLVTFEKYYK